MSCPCTLREGASSRLCASPACGALHGALRIQLLELWQRVQAHCLARTPSASLACSGLTGLPRPQLWLQVLEPRQGRGARVPMLLLLLRLHVRPAVVGQWGPLRPTREQAKMEPVPRTKLLEMLQSRREILEGWLRYLPANCRGSHPTLKQVRLQINRRLLHPAGRAWPLPSTGTGSGAQPHLQVCTSRWNATPVPAHTQGSLVTC